MRPILTREFSFQLIFGICTLPRSQYWKYNIPRRCSRFFTVTSIMVSKQTYLKMRSLEGMFSARLSSRNCSPNFVFLKDSFLFCNLTLFSDGSTQDCCCCRRCCFSRRPDVTRIVKATVSRCTLEDSSSFQRCSNLVSLTRDIPR